MVKKIVLIVLVIIMAVPFTACKKKEKENTSSDEYEYMYQYEDGSLPENLDSSTVNSTNKISGTNAAWTNSGDTNLTDNVYASGFPIVKKKEKLSIMCTTRADLGDIANSDFAKTFENLSNIKIDWQLVSESEVSQRRILALQSGNLPDILALPVTDSEMLQYHQEKSFQEIKKSDLKKWAPNIYSTYEAFPESWVKTKATDGKMYSIAGFSKDNEFGQHFVWIRKTWLNKLGLSMPKNTNEFYDMLNAFKIKDPNGNGQADEIPYATFSHGGFFFQPWGFDNANIINVSKNGKVTNMYTTSNMKDAVTYWNKIYKEGLVDTKTIDNWTGNSAAFKTLLSGGKVGAFFYGWPSEAMDESLLKEYEVMPWISSGNNGEFSSSYVSNDPVVKRDSFIITKKCKNVPAALRWLDYLYTDDGYMLKVYGNVGSYYSKVSDNTYRLTGKAKVANAGPSWSLKGRNFLLKSKFEGSRYTGVTEVMYNKRDTMESWCASNIAKNGQLSLPDAYQTKDEINKIKLYSTYYNSVKDSYWQFIKDTKNIGSDWTALLNEMSSKGMNEYVKTMQSYYDRVK